MLKCNFRANFGDLSLGFDVKAPIPQGLTGSPNYFGLLNNLMTLNFCESLREIGEMACVTSAWSSRGQTLKIAMLFLVYGVMWAFSGNPLLSVHPGCQEPSFNSQFSEKSDGKTLREHGCRQWRCFQTNFGGQHWK